MRMAVDPQAKGVELASATVTALRSVPFHSVVAVTVENDYPVLLLSQFRVLLLSQFMVITPCCCCQSSW